MPGATTRDDGMLLIERPEGWPRGAGRLLGWMGLLVLVTALVVPNVPRVRGHVNHQAYWIEVAAIVLVGAAFLLLWRRGAIIDHDACTMIRWWGVAGLDGPIILRRSSPRSLLGYTGVRVLRTDETEHYKRFREPVYHVQLEKSESVGGQVSLRERIVVDDEIRDPADAGQTGRRLAEYLSVDLIDRTV